MRKADVVCLNSALAAAARGTRWRLALQALASASHPDQAGQRWTLTLPTSKSRA